MLALRNLPAKIEKKTKTANRRQDRAGLRPRHQQRQTGLLRSFESNFAGAGRVNEDQSLAGIAGAS
jgi:hypothetical protein